ncbi:hypothetical protein EUTSA_v10012157mg, partial [Eutrema salsugineum]
FVSGNTLWVPTLSLARIRSTSKGWNALVKDELLSKKHSAPRQSLAIMLIDFRVYLVSINLLGTQENDVAPSRKLTRQFSLKDPLSDSSEEVDIRNIFHWEIKWIQPRKSYYKTDHFALGYDSKSSCYKIIRMDRFVRGDLFQTANEIYDFTSNSWSVVGVTTVWFIAWSHCRGVSVSENTYWLAHSRHRPPNTSLSNTLISFDFSTVRFQTHYLPHDSVVALSLVSENQLCLLGVNPLEIWIASKIESTEVMSWIKFLTAKPDYAFSPWMSFMVDEQSKVLVCYDNEMVPNNFLHIVSEDRYIQVNFHGSKTSCSFLLSYVPSLVQIQQGKYVVFGVPEPY